LQIFSKSILECRQTNCGQPLFEYYNYLFDCFKQGTGYLPYFCIKQNIIVMKYRNLGTTNEQLSAIGLGCMGMSFAYGPTDEKENITTLERALDLGINFWDTADMYGNGANEDLISKVLV